METIIRTPPTSPDGILQDSQQKRNGEKQRRKHAREKSIKTARLEEKLKTEIRRTERYRKRLQRMKNQKEVPLTPRGKTKKLMQMSHTSIRRSLMFHNVLIEKIKARYKHTKGERARRVYTTLFSGQIVKKY